LVRAAIDATAEAGDADTNDLLIAFSMNGLKAVFAAFER
jgi:hypothetical protein